MKDIRNWILVLPILLVIVAIPTVQWLQVKLAEPYQLPFPVEDIQSVSIYDDDALQRKDVTRQADIERVAAAFQAMKLLGTYDSRDMPDGGQVFEFVFYLRDGTTAHCVFSGSVENKGFFADETMRSRVARAAFEDLWAELDYEPVTAYTALEIDSEVTLFP